ncbi:PREDICTED: IQ domain-containing protein E-like, partial [Galeopterus variegatus]|uniref:IQ domain-containing protein E-like n=1 Tax=Galeopterus variegatus TaxID=482537 RepID=A0ABM0Q4X0_GALVR
MHLGASAECCGISLRRTATPTQGPVQLSLQRESGRLRTVEVVKLDVVAFYWQVINGLKQRILKLEQQCKEKDNTINKLQTDIKTTNLEEMRIAMEMYYEEIHRLQSLLPSSEATGK